METTIEAIEFQKTVKTNGGLFLKLNGNYQCIAYNNILRLTATGNYTTFYFTHSNQVFISSKTLQIFNNHLPDELFIRPHRSHLINKQFIQSIGSSTNMFLTLMNNEKIPVARRRYSWVKQELIIGKLK